MDSATPNRHRPANWKASMGIRFLRALNKGYPRALYAGERDAARGRKKALVLAGLGERFSPPKVVKTEDALSKDGQSYFMMLQARA